jgi:CBS domain-containing protein
MSLIKIAQVPPAIVDPDRTVLEAVEAMAEHGVGAVAVVDKAGGNVLKGIFTERDVMLRVVLRQLHPARTKVGEVMTSPAETISEEVTAEDAFALMIGRHMRHLPIVSSDGHLLGMLSVRNLLEHVIEGLQREIHSLDLYLSADGPGG